MWKAPDLGLFGLLKKDISTITEDSSKPEDKDKWTKAAVKQIKVGFIEKCGQTRENEKNKELNKNKAGSEDIKVGNITIQFEKKNQNLVPSDDTLFNSWFISEEDSKKSHSTTTSGG